MKTTIGFRDFCDAFVSYGRNDQFSYKGKRALFDWIEDLEQDMGEEIELDVIALCCDYSEYTLDEIRDYYSNMLEGDEEDEDLVEWLHDQTIVIYVDDSTYIIQAF